ncbi:MAG: helix-turn-helix transcriptional regulator [Saprospiraceae bacterium]|jgi:transcriptional regulator with XRE-family HTH domain|nr:helix-turn-helix transcriptional regulator [Saprospiraceae bacterium]HMT55051.1 helix-turn-helix transcriptional regulator [Saprospiraceae bacterium]HMT72185.1 helix-turn-helix transcriptional regulator [Saprospiraceae bacterium]
METGNIITNLRKEKDWSQADLANKSGVSREMIGKYERGEAVPSIEAAKKIADAFEVSLDYLVGEGINSKFDKKTVKRLQDIEKLEAKDKEHVFAMLDAFLAKNKLQAILA